MKTIRSKRYRTYVLRCWRETPPAPVGAATIEGVDNTWRFALVEVLTEQPQHGFATFDELVSFLRTDLLRPSKPEQYEPGPRPDRLII